MPNSKSKQKRVRMTRRQKWRARKERARQRILEAKRAKVQ